MNTHNIVIKLRFETKEGLRAKGLIQSLDGLENALYASDRRDIELVSDRLKISSVVRDACLERLRKHRHGRFLVSGARNGSLELFGLVAGVSYFVLKATIGESLKEGYKETETHQRLKEYFRRNIEDKAITISENMRKIFSTSGSRTEIRLIEAKNNNPIEICVDVSAMKRSEKTSAKSLGDELDENPQK